jgi:hypothetical protein
VSSTLSPDSPPWEGGAGWEMALMLTFEFTLCFLEKTLNQEELILIWFGFLVFEIGSYCIAQAGLKLATLLPPNPSAGITGVQHNTFFLFFQCWGLNLVHQAC